MTALFALGAASCARRAPPTRGAVPLPVRIAADTARGERWPVARPPARVWLERVGRERASGALGDAPAAPAPPRGAAPEPEAALDTLRAVDTPPALEIPDDLKPPLLRHAP